MTGITMFMGYAIPSTWLVTEDPTVQSFIVSTAHGFGFNVTAIELTRMLKQEQDFNEQHRPTHTPPRGATSAPPTAGHPGGAHPALSTFSAAAGQRAGQGDMNAFTSNQSGQQLNQQPPMWQKVQMAMEMSLCELVTPASPLPTSPPAWGELVGHRCWRVNQAGNLQSVSYHLEWLPGEVIRDTSLTPCDVYHSAACIADRNQCGVWAYTNPYDLAWEFGRHDYNNLVYGTVWLWGTVIEHERGYRAQYAAVRSLDRAPGINLDLEALRVRYCPETKP